MSLKKSINKLLCTWAQEPRKDADGNDMKKPDGTYYMKNKVTFGEAFTNLILRPGVLIICSWAIISWIGWISPDIYTSGSITPNPGNLPWIFKYLVMGMITIMSLLLVILFLGVIITIINMLWNWEIAECPCTEVPELEQLPGIYPIEEPIQGNEIIEE